MTGGAGWGEEDEGLSQFVAKNMPIIPKSPEFASQSKNIQLKAGLLKRLVEVTGGGEKRRKD